MEEAQQDPGGTQRDPWQEGADPWKRKGTDAKVPQSQSSERSYGPAGRGFKGEKTNAPNSQPRPTVFDRLSSTLTSNPKVDEDSTNKQAPEDPGASSSGPSPFTPTQVQEAMMAFFQCLQTGEFPGSKVEARTKDSSEVKKEGKGGRRVRSREREGSRGRRRRRQDDEDERRKKRSEKAEKDRGRKPPRKQRDRDEDPEGDDPSDDDEGDESGEEEEPEEDKEQEVLSRRRQRKKKGRRPSSGGDSSNPSSSSYSRSSMTDSTARTSEVKSMLRKKVKNQYDRPRSSLGSVKIEEFYGDRSRYRKWKTAVQAQEVLYHLEEEELSMLIYLSTKKDARDVLDQQPISEYTQPGGIKLVWNLLDEAFGETEEELFERAEVEFHVQETSRTVHCHVPWAVEKTKGPVHASGPSVDHVGSSMSTADTEPLRFESSREAWCVFQCRRKVSGQRSRECTPTSLWPSSWR